MDKIQQLKINLRKSISRAFNNSSLLILSFIAYTSYSFNNNLGVFNIICNIFLTINLLIIFMHTFYYFAEFYDVIKEANTIDPENSAGVLSRMETSWWHILSITFTRLLIIPAFMYIISRMILFHSLWSYIVYGLLSSILIFLYLLISVTITDIKRLRKQMNVGGAK